MTRPPTTSGIVTFDLVWNRRIDERSGSGISSVLENARISPFNSFAVAQGKCSLADALAGGAGHSGRAQ